MQTKTQGDCMFGTSHWYGTINGCPVVLVAYYSGCTVWFFKQKWHSKSFKDVSSAHEWLELEDK